VVGGEIGYVNIVKSHGEESKLLYVFGGGWIGRRGRM